MAQPCSRTFRTVFPAAKAREMPELWSSGVWYSRDGIYLVVLNLMEGNWRV